MITVELSHREARALHNMGTLFAAAFEDLGCDLTDCELPDGEQHAVSPLVGAVMQLELASGRGGRR